MIHALVLPQQHTPASLLVPVVPLSDSASMSPTGPNIGFKLNLKQHPCLLVTNNLFKMEIIDYVEYCDCILKLSIVFTTLSRCIIIFLPSLTKDFNFHTEQQCKIYNFYITLNKKIYVANFKRCMIDKYIVVQLTTNNLSLI